MSRPLKSFSLQRQILSNSLESGCCVYLVCVLQKRVCGVLVLELKAREKQRMIIGSSQQKA